MLLGTIEQSFIFAIMVLGVYISYKILDFPDMTVDGSFPLGAAVSAALIVKGVNPLIALVVAMLAGAVAGLITGMIHVKLKVTNLLAGIIVMTGLYSVNLRIMGKSNIPLFMSKHLFNGTVSAIVVVVIFLLIVKLAIDFLLKTKFGFVLKALGDNESLVIALGLDGNKLKLYGLMIANSLVALSGGILAQYQGFADVGMGTGTIITGLASIIIGEAVIGKKKIIKATTMVIIGTVIYRAIIALSLKLGMTASDLKLITSILVVIIIYLKLKKESLKKGGVVNA
ncbi:ribose ABC transporter permease protein [Fusobacterium necrogenes]|uniref:Ribose ABC transporter permease protein n=1 Tax=Fusobacterium necrogenes TaxID=858 RepID=A0A377GVH4_9FUSO|nr:ABC transporter permease [Fusobacterium necrogenes]STO30980.1 ribose ABC transporter permease protein [Fusobacterium necrogenes]